MGGTIAKLASQGHRVHLLDMTNGEPTPLGSIETRAKEAAEAARALGVERSLLGLPNRRVVHDLESRHKTAAAIRQHRPDWIFVPYPIDAHPDHVAVARIGEDARFGRRPDHRDVAVGREQRSLGRKCGNECSHSALVSKGYHQPNPLRGI